MLAPARAMAAASGVAQPEAVTTFAIVARLIESNMTIPADGGRDAVQASAKFAADYADSPAYKRAEYDTCFSRLIEAARDQWASGSRAAQASGARRALERVDARSAESISEGWYVTQALSLVASYMLVDVRTDFVPYFLRAGVSE